MTAWRVASAFFSVLRLSYDALVAGHSLREVRREGVDVVDASPELGDRAGIFVDGNEKGMNFARHCCSLNGPHEDGLD